MNRYEKGMVGEQAVAEYLEITGHDIADRNYRTNDGEIDVIFFDEDILVFGEVKTRNGTSFGLPCEAVDYRKKKKIIYVAKQYIYSKGIEKLDFRFDIFEVYLQDKKIRHIKNAYSETE